MEHNKPEIEFSIRKKHFYTPADEAVKEIEKRRTNPEIFAKVSAFLNNDVPSHFNQNKPILYLSRHIATPNFECQKFFEMSKEYNLPIVIGQDSKGVFVSLNFTKKCLGRMSILTETTQPGDEIFENVTVIDFNACEGKELGTIQTKFGTTLVEFHNNLVSGIYTNKIEIAEESNWLDEHYRADLLKQYEQMLALNICHGILFESFPPDEELFFSRIFEIAFTNVQSHFKLKPLVVETINDTEEAMRDWNAYPQTVRKLI